MPFYGIDFFNGVEYATLPGDNPDRPAYLIGDDATVWCRWLSLHRAKRELGHTWRQIKVKPNVHAYVVISISIPGKPSKAYGLHRLMLMAFKGNRRAPAVARHWDNNPWNNSLENLRWGTKSQNAYDAIKRPRLGPKEKIEIAKIKNRSNESAKAEAKRYGVTLERIKRIWINNELYLLKRPEPVRISDDRHDGLW